MKRITQSFNEAPVNSPGKGRFHWAYNSPKVSFNEAPVNSPGKGGGERTMGATSALLQ